MWLAKLRHGVLRIATPVGPRYVRPPFSQRAYLLWMFRNFNVLPVQVLNAKQQELVAQLSADDRWAALRELREKLGTSRN